MTIDGTEPKKVDGEPYVYEFTYFSVLELSFGFFDGAINAMPKGSYMSQCGENSKNMRIELLNATNYMIERDLTNMVERIYNALSYVYNMNLYCYYGFSSFISAGFFSDLILKWDLPMNIAYNSGYIYTDLIMLFIGVPGETTVDWMYYVFFYVGDLVFRFLFKTASSNTCWYPWNACSAALLGGT